MPAFAAAAAALECELTVPEVAQSVVLTRVGGRASRMPEAEKLAAFAATGATLVIHLAVHALETIVAELTPFYGADCAAAVVVQATSPDERVLRGTLADIAAKVAAERSSAPRSSSSAARSAPRIFATARSTTPTIGVASAEARVERSRSTACHEMAAGQTAAPVWSLPPCGGG